MELLRDNVRASRTFLNAASCATPWNAATGLRRLHEHGAAPDGHRERSGCPIAIADWDAASARTPHFWWLAPSGPRPLIDLYCAGGVPAVMESRGGWGLLDESALTCMGPLPGIWRDAAPGRWRGVLHGARTSFYFPPQGAPKVLYGNLVPDGSVVKKAAVDPSMLCHTGPARVFDSEEAACAANKRRRDRPGRCGGHPL